jgi:hypothetical protein
MTKTRENVEVKYTDDTAGITPNTHLAMVLFVIN